MRLLILLFVCCSVGLSAQPPTTGVTDRVDVRNGPNLRGRLIGYAYRQSVTLVDRNGEVHTVDWPDVKRVYFEYDRRPAGEAPDEEPTTLQPPVRKWHHHLQLRAGGTRENVADFNFGPTSRSTYGIGAGYHLLRVWKRLQFGPGVGYDLLSLRRQERMVSLTALARLALTDWRIRPLVSLEAGGSLPIGSASFPLDRRGLGSVVHPAFGAVLTPTGGQWGEIGLHLGYRISAATFSGTNANLEVIEREVTYRRLTLSATAAF